MDSIEIEILSNGEFIISRNNSSANILTEEFLLELDISNMEELSNFLSESNEYLFGNNPFCG